MSTLRERPGEYRGHVSNGVVVFESTIELPDGAEVRVRPAKPQPTRAKARKMPPTLYERLKPIIGKAKGLPPDASINHDHYLYGAPKRR